MESKLFVGNLPFSMDDDGLSQLFGEAGEVVSARVIRDRETGRSKGFGFVEMSNDDEVNAAVERFNGSDVDGRNIRVDRARPREGARPTGRRQY